MRRAGAAGILFGLALVISGCSGSGPSELADTTTSTLPGSTSSTSPTDSTAAAPTSTASSPRVLNFVDVSESKFDRGVVVDRDVQGGRAWVAIGGRSNARPSVFISSDGDTWETVRLAVEGLPSTKEIDVLGLEAGASNMLALMIAGSDPLSGADTPTMFQATSTDGLDWEVSAAVDLSRAESVFVAREKVTDQSEAGVGFMTLNSDELEFPLADLLNSFVETGQPFDCLFGAQVDGQDLEVFRCGATESERYTQSDLGDADFDDVAACARILPGGGWDTDLDVVFQSGSIVRRWVIDVANPLGPMLSPGGTPYVFDFGADLSPCNGLIQIPETYEPGLLRLDTDGSITRVAIPPEVTELLSNPLAAAAAAEAFDWNGEELWIWRASGVWSYDPASGQWTDRLAQVELLDGFEVADVLPKTSTAVIRNDTQLLVIDLERGVVCASADGIPRGGVALGDDWIAAPSETGQQLARNAGCTQR